jgi:hypothetical protein
LSFLFLERLKPRFFSICMNTNLFILR